MTAPERFAEKSDSSCTAGAGGTGEDGPPVRFRSIPVVEWSPAPSMSGRN
jgi:hypothetical protein